ncbi:hypothetical protein [Paraburkholderia sp. RL17-337-BIB-A]|uniref:hypothetical protein n=1 Tax=Paraburkholderia sp. RL17-337-BIB-A TaxID=3031636 RepID=UPI0038B7A7A5
MAPRGKQHCDTLDLIRALAAGAVCVSHLRNLMFVDYRASAGLGLAGKAFYFVSNYGHTAVIALLCNVVFLQTLTCGTYGSNGPLWSLANEFWYYMWFPACYVLLRQRRGFSAIVAGVLALGTMIAFPSLLSGFGLWMLGVALVLPEKRFPARGEVCHGSRLPAGPLFLRRWCCRAYSC